jgi:hypothetical protein
MIQLTLNESKAIFKQTQQTITVKRHYSYNRSFYKLPHKRHLCLRPRLITMHCTMHCCAMQCIVQYIAKAIQLGGWVKEDTVSYY